MSTILGIMILGIGEALTTTLGVTTVGTTLGIHHGMIHGTILGIAHHTGGGDTTDGMVTIPGIVLITVIATGAEYAPIAEADT